MHLRGVPVPLDAGDTAGADSTQPLAGRVAVVTGGGSGIGRAIAVTLAAHGARVILGYATSVPGALETVRTIVEAGGDAMACRADVTQAADLENLAAEAEALGGPQLWVNNAGASANTSETRGMTDEERWDRVMRVDVKGTWLASRIAAPLIRAAGGGGIVNIGWNHALDGEPGAVSQIYAASKAAVLALTRCLAQEWAPDIRVNAVAPGWIANEWAASRTPAFRERISGSIPLGRWGTPDDIAAAVLYLCSPASGFMTGQTLIVDGGEVMR